MELFTISKTKIRDIEANYNNQNANINNSNNLEATRGAINDYVHRKIAIDYYHEKLNENGVNSDEFFTLMKNGYFKLNDFSTSYVKPHNCSNLDVRDILRNGFETVNLVKSNPPRHLDSTLNVLFEAFMGISSHQSGGVGAVCLNWFLAPLLALDGLSSSRLKQLIQNFCFRLNQSCVGRDGGSMFSSISFDLVCPGWLSDQETIPDTGKTYKDFQYEADKILKTFVEVLLEGDAKNNTFLFPNPVFNIKGGDLSKYPEIFELVTKFYTPYFVNYPDDIEYKTIMGCRTALFSNYTNDPEKDCMRAGNAVYSCITLPKLALESNSYDDFYNNLDYIMGLLKEYSVIRYDRILELFNSDKMYYHKQFVDILNCSLVIGVLGLDDCVRILTTKFDHDESDLTYDLGYQKAEEILDFMEFNTKEYKKETGYRWAVFSSPSESTCYEMAKKVVGQVGLEKSYAHGTKDQSYYTNGINLDYETNCGLIKRIEIESNLSQYTKGGNIVALNLSEAYSDPVGIRLLTERIRDNTKAPFWAFSKPYTICNECFVRFNYDINNTTCPICYSDDTTSYARITGYQAIVSKFNPGKKKELENRYYH